MTDFMKRKANSNSPFGLAELIDVVCAHFEAAWKEGVRPRLEDYLDAFDELKQTRILRELLYVELACRRKISEQPMADEYHERFPGHEELIGEVFSARRFSTDK